MDTVSPGAELGWGGGGVCRALWSEILATHGQTLIWEAGECCFSLQCISDFIFRRESTDLSCKKTSLTPGVSVTFGDWVECTRTLQPGKELDQVGMWWRSSRQERAWKQARKGERGRMWLQTPGSHCFACCVVLWLILKEHWLDNCSWRETVRRSGPGVIAEELA